MASFNSGFVYLLVAFVAFYALFAVENKRIKLALIGAMVLFYWLSTLQHEEYKNSKEGQENFRLGKNRVLCQERFFVEVSSYGLNPMRFKFNNLSPIDPDHIKKEARGGMGLPDYEFNCLFERGTSRLTRFRIYPY
tara:strand:- start:189 stop:596 length:408 start_codon:yes stop_codon:yes gene_type:complete